SQEGLVMQALADVVFSPASALLLTAGARIPFLDLRRGPIWTSPVFLVSLVVDV
ncbi:MAG: hypothetical protein JNK82_06180, partial [Myxococcaceae bacterium]|nr:hypothetical protein [Myxococcaceae bacterium]